MNTKVPPSRSTHEALLGWVFPNICQICESEPAYAADGYLGVECLKKVRRLEPPFCDRCGLPFEGQISHTFTCGNCAEMDLEFSRARAAVLATPILLDILHRYKYSRHRWFEPWLGSWLVDAAATSLRQEKWDLLIPVPLHPVRRREREFNQAEELALILSKGTGITVEKRAVIRELPTETQTNLSRKERSENVRQAFGPGPAAGNLRGKKCVVIDDVLTTGATMSSAARVLRKHGATDVIAWSVARAVF